MVRILTIVELDRFVTKTEEETMNKYSFVLALVMLITLTNLGTSDAQSKVQNARVSTRVSETTFIAEPITVETPTATLYGTLERPDSIDHFGLRADRP